MGYIFFVTSLFLVKSWLKDESRCLILGQEGQLYVRVVFPLCATISRVLFDVAHCIPMGDYALYHWISCVYHLHHSFTSWILSQSFFQVVHSSISYSVIFVRSLLALVRCIQRGSVSFCFGYIVSFFRLSYPRFSILGYIHRTFLDLGLRFCVFMGHQQVPQVSCVKVLGTQPTSSRGDSRMLLRVGEVVRFYYPRASHLGY